jgi:two-component system response regulator ChvI
LGLKCGAAPKLKATIASSLFKVMEWRHFVATIWPDSAMQLGSEGEHAMGHKIAIVDDDENLLESLGCVLKEEGFEIDTYSSGEQALRGMRIRPVDLAIVDLCLPNVFGFKLFKKLKKIIPSVAVIFLTARHEDFYESSGLELGADDFIRKPCKNEVLVARVNSRIRQSSSEKQDYSERFIKGELEVDIERRQCSWRGCSVPHLTKCEFKIVSFLARRAGVVRSRDQIISHVYGDGYAIQDQAIDTHKKRIVKKFKSIDAEFNQIQAEYGDGYRWREASNSRLPARLETISPPSA